MRPAGFSRRALTLALMGAVGLLLAAAPQAMADWYTFDEPRSPNAEDIKVLYDVALYIGLVVFLIVEGTLIYSLIRFRARRGQEGAPIRGNTPLELGWTVAASLIVVLLTALTFIYLDPIKDPTSSDASGFQAAKGVRYATIDQPAPPNGRRLEIGVNGQQYLWRYDYPESIARERLFTYYEMVVPTNTTVTLKITSSDVVHSWWIPALGGKADATPGHTNETWFKIDRPGTYRGVCAELCGAGHADMRARVRAIPPDEFRVWAQRQAAGIKEAQEQLAISRREREGG